MQRKPAYIFSVKGQDPREAGPALFSNFLAISRLGTELQFEFVFLDLNQLATVLKDEKEQKVKEGETGSPTTIVGRTVAKVVMPAVSFVQLREHINGLFDAIEKDLRESSEAEHGRSRTGSY